MTHFTKSQIQAINKVAAGCHAIAKSKGFYHKPESVDQFIERSCNNLHDEVSELHTAWRSGDLDRPCDKAEKMTAAGIAPLTCLEEELADIVIRAFDTAARLKVDIGSAIDRKSQFNKTRPIRHGGKKS